MLKFICALALIYWVYAQDNPPWYPYVPGEQNYTCDRSVGGPSLIVPTNVNQLRPGDIRVIAALGDSLTCAYGALGWYLPDIDNAYEGVSFACGGDQDITYTVSVANMLKYFNPHQYGQSLGLEQFPKRLMSVEQLNVAHEGDTVWEMPGQAQELIYRMRNSSTIDYYNDWKYINIFYGGNDECRYCAYPDKLSPANMTIKLNETLSILSQIPRAFVQLLGMFDLQVLRSVGWNIPKCDVTHRVECICDENTNFTAADFETLTDAYQYNQLLVEQAMTFERDDWTFVLQPILNYTRQAPLNPDGTTDMSWFAPDCFHFSIKGHNTIGRYLWNAMLQPVGQKETNANVSDNALPLLCPDPACPYLRTIKNSQYCIVTPQGNLL